MRDTRLYSPAQLAPILSVSESTIKRWVDAGHLRAIKSPGGHRKIALPDLLAFLRARGRPAPSLEGLGLLAEHVGAPDRSVASPPALAGLLLRGDVQVARAMLGDQLRAGRHMDDLLDRLVAPAMTEIGALWAQGQIDIHQEHVATLRAWGLLLELRELLPPPPPRAPLALGAAPAGDPYLLPCLMAEMTLTEQGWATVNSGPDTPLASLAGAIAVHRPELVWLSITSTELGPGFADDYARLFESAQAQGASVMLGGQGLTPELQDRLVASAFGTRLTHLGAFARTLGSG
jgi:excisionase family DNA binding protein